MRLDLLVELKTVDQVRETALPALRDRLGWGDCLADLRRYDLWRFDGRGASSQEFRSSLERELERTSSYYNPNKQTRVLVDENWLTEGESLSADIGGEPAADGTQAGEACRESLESGDGELWQGLLWVTDEGGLRPDLVRSSGAQMAADGIDLDNIRCGTLWKITVRASGQDHAREIITAMALTRGRRAGLLFNPHYQEGVLLELKPVAGEEVT